MNWAARYRVLIQKKHISRQKKTWSSKEDYNLTTVRNIPLNDDVIKMVT